MLGLFQVPDEFEVLVEDGGKETPPFLCPLRSAHGSSDVEGCLPGSLG